jgi:mono/diheme cytochrome c family protein
MPPLSEDDAEQIARGEQIFRRQGCASCHVPPLTYTTDAVFDVGLRDEAGLEKFNPPTLRGVSHRRHFFHDQRAGGLEEVFVDHDHMAQGLNEDEIEDLIRFLMSL